MIRSRAGRPRFESSLRLRVQIDSGVHPASYPTDTGVSFLAGETVGAWSYIKYGVQEQVETLAMIQSQTLITASNEMGR